MLESTEGIDSTGTFKDGSAVVGTATSIEGARFGGVTIAADPMPVSKNVEDTIGTRSVGAAVVSSVGDNTPVSNDGAERAGMLAEGSSALGDASLGIVASSEGSDTDRVERSDKAVIGAPMEKDGGDIPVSMDGTDRAGRLVEGSPALGNPLLGMTVSNDGSDAVGPDKLGKPVGRPPIDSHGCGTVVSSGGTDKAGKLVEGSSMLDTAVPSEGSDAAGAERLGKPVDGIPADKEGRDTAVSSEGTDNAGRLVEGSSVLGTARLGMEGESVGTSTLGTDTVGTDRVGLGTAKLGRLVGRADENELSMPFNCSPEFASKLLIDSMASSGADRLGSATDGIAVESVDTAGEISGRLVGRPAGMAEVRSKLTDGADTDGKLGSPVGGRPAESDGNDSQISGMLVAGIDGEVSGRLADGKEGESPGMLVSGVDGADEARSGFAVGVEIDGKLSVGLWS